jgi:hypothetical protein
MIFYNFLQFFNLFIFQYYIFFLFYFVKYLINYYFNLFKIYFFLSIKFHFFVIIRKFVKINKICYQFTIHINFNFINNCFYYYLIYDSCNSEILYLISIQRFLSNLYYIITFVFLLICLNTLL